MKTILSTTCAAFLALCVAVPATAASLKVTFTGTVEQTNDPSNNITTNLGQLNTGDAVSGMFTLDTLTPELSGPDSSSYFAAISGFEMTLDGLTFVSNTDNNLLIANNRTDGSSSPQRDYMSFRSSDVAGPLVDGLAPSVIQFALGGTDTSVLSDSSMVDEADILALFAADTIAGDLNFVSFAGSEARFMVNSVSVAAVPLPAAAPMMLVALGGFAALRRRKSKAA